MRMVAASLLPLPVIVSPSNDLSPPYDDDIIAICHPQILRRRRRRRLRRVIHPSWTRQQPPCIYTMVGILWVTVINNGFTISTSSAVLRNHNHFMVDAVVSEQYPYSKRSTILRQNDHDDDSNDKNDRHHPHWFRKRISHNDDNSNINEQSQSIERATYETKERFERWLKLQQQQKLQRQRSRRFDNHHHHHHHQNIDTDDNVVVPIIHDPSFTFHLHPTSILSIASERQRRRRKLLPQLLHHHNHNLYNSNHSDSNGNNYTRRINYHHYTNITDNDTADVNNIDYHRQWFAAEETSAVYATIPDEHDPKHQNNRMLQEFYMTRHLSRHERFYRQQHSFNTVQQQQPKWNGYYNDTAFLQQFVHFDDELFYSTFYNITATDNNTKQQQQQQQNMYTNCTNSNHNISKSRSRRRQQHYINQTNSRRDLDQQRQSSATISHDKVITGGVYNNYQSVPLSQGYGTHFANVWVGTPVPQRKTVIVDTGSHYTAFPCTGCKDCGAPHHTDPYYRPENSKTFEQLQCNECQDSVPCENSKCKFSQAYTEGSSWEAIQVRDLFYCGGTDVLDSASPTDQKYAIEFMFGCQVSMTGLFKTQLADGIMGMSAHPATLPKKLYDAKKLEHNMFAMCYRRELGTSKRGVSAGSMTLGGVSNNLDTSPFVFAKNVVKVGWYTVYVKNIYIRSGGGQSARSVDPTHQTIQVRLNAKTLNSGKGVIVDSGTTDTYLNKRVAADFTRAWKKATGQAYSHVPLLLTPEQLRNLPTVLIQCQAFSKSSDPTIEDYDTIPGYTGSLDPLSPRDLLIAIPATSYMDYSPITQRYMSRLYFTESVGGVLGSNTMQGHNVLFDWQNGRVGFAESSCTYDKKDVPEVAQDDGFAADCKVSDPILTRACVDTFDRSLCDRNPTGIALYGNETWTAIVENPGNDAGMPCFEPVEPVNQLKDPLEPTIICSGQGICEEFRPCLLTCPQVKKAAEVKPLPVQLTEKKNRFRCGDTGWSACDYGCAQTRITSRAYSDGICHEVARISRPCHIGACSREDPCRVPFVVHVVLAFHSGLVKKWSNEAEEILSVALTNVVDNGMGQEKSLFTPGDVFVSLALPWYQDQDEYDIETNDETIKRDYSDNYNNVVLGLKVVVEISVYNPLSDLPNKVAIVDNGHEESNNGAFASMLQNITYLVRGRKPRAICSPEELYPLAKLTLDAKEVIRGENFMMSLIDELKKTGTRYDTEAFGPITLLAYNVSESRVASVWTIRTGIDDVINYFGPQKAFSVRILSILRSLFFLSTLFFLVMVFWNAVTAIRNYCLGCAQPKRQINHKMTVTPRNIPYSIITRIEDSNNELYDVEDSIIMGLGEDIELPNQVTYRSSMVTKRTNRTSPISNKSHH